MKLEMHERHWHDWNKLPNVTHISYGNNGLSYGFNRILGTFSLIKHVDGWGDMENRRKIADGLTFPEAQELFYIVRERAR